MTRAAVLAAGTWGTAFGKVLADAGGTVTLWAREPELAQAIRATRQNPRYLPGVALPDGVTAVSDADEALEGADFVVLAIPSQHLRENLAKWRSSLPDDAVLVSLMKGVELGTTKRMSEVIAEVSGFPSEQIAAVTGPNLAREIAAEQPAATVVACSSEQNAKRLQAVTHTLYFRPYTNTDVIGCELGGAVKNVIALATGMAHGMGFGDNTKASLITRGLAETTRLGVALGADSRTFAGLAGVGDLVATCMSPLSRNRSVGEKLGRGMPLDEVMATQSETAEGVKSCEAIYQLARDNDVDMPITEHVVRVVRGGESPRDLVTKLMGREAKPE